ncbi:MAG: InlB B-repeat-containing protein [Lachnospiraceae bacterium]|nr:InlB B-repeat-containing protein [Lachnospiraceae bacterium]
MMKKKLLCMLLSIAMVFTVTDTPVSASEIQTTNETAAPESSASPENTAPEDSTAQESTPAQNETAEEKETQSEPAQTETETGGNAADQTQPETETASSGETLPTQTQEETDSEDKTETETYSDLETEEETLTEDSTNLESESETETEETAEETTDTELQAAYHTADEIQEFIAQEKAAKTDSITYRTEPDLKAPYSAGALSEDTRNAAASMLRQIRFIAGLPYDVAVNEEYSHLSQSAALLNYINNALSPNPSQPEGMSEELFHQGCEGAAHSNIAYADDPSKTLNDTLLGTWMAENGNGSSSTLENRRRILNPSLNQVGFGVVKGDNGIYSAMYTTETAEARAERSRIAWPAQNMPVEYFDSSSPWSVTTGELIDASDIRVTLTREADAKTWTFSADAADGAFDVNNDRAAQESVLIFRPEAVSDYADGDSFQIEITKNEKPYIRYTVNFFSISNEEEKLTAPKASIADGEVVAKESKLVLTSAENAAIYYTLDGTTPTAESTLYTEPILLETDITVQAVAIKEGCADSDIAAFTYTVEEALPLRYTVTFVSDDGVVLLAASVIENENIELPDPPVKEGFVFENWYKETACENKWDFENDTVTEDLTLYAKWTVLSYTVSFDLQGQGTPIPSISADHGTLLTAPDAPTAEGYVFEGWYKEPECKTVWDFATELVSADATLYAKWTEEAAAEAAYVVTFDMQGVGTQLKPVSVVKGELLTAPAEPSAEGYAFAEWYREADCTNAWNFETDPVTEDLVLYAKWVQTDDALLSTSNAESHASTKIALTTENIKISTIKAKVYDGKPYLPAVKVSYKDGTKWVNLTEGVDYSIRYSNNTNAGIGQVIIQGGGAYENSVTKDFEIKKKPINKLKVITDSLTVGSNPTKSLRLWVYDGSRVLGGKEYTLEYDAENLTKKKTTSAKVVVRAAETSNYSGSVTTKVTVYDLKDTDRLLGPSNVQFEVRSAVYTGKPITTAVEPKVIYKVSNKETITLEKNKDYKLQYQNNIDTGTAYVIVTGKGQYKGKVVGQFTIIASDTTLEIKPIPAKTYNGSLQKPKLTVKANNKTLKLDKDYTVSYGNNLNATTTARVVVTGIGNYAKAPKQTVNFEIKQQKMSKASLQGSLTTGITLTYNKRLLTEGRDYNKPVYDTVKGSKVAVTITGKGNFTGELKKSASVDVPKSKMSPVISSNRNRQNYATFEGVIMHSYLLKTGDNFMRVEHVSGKGIYAETYTSDFTLRSRKYIKLELPKFGGFYEGSQYYFLVFGQENPDEDNETEVMRIVKYDKKWNRKGAASIYGANTYSPFKNGGLRMAESGDMLYIRTCHQMYKTYDDNRHQASAAFSVRIPKMEVTEQIVGISQTAYVSHSFNQFILTDGSDLLAVDHGDAYPRSVALAKYVEKAGSENIHNKGCSRIAALKIQGKSGNPYTGVSVGGFEASDTAYLIAGNSVDQTPETYSSGGVRNIFVSSTQKDNFTQEGTTVHWITNYKSQSEASVTTPQLVKISGTEFILMWGEGTQVKCVLLNASGEPTTGIYSYDGMLSDCKPIAVNGNVMWYYTNKSAPVFYTLNPEDVRKVPR